MHELPNLLAVELNHEIVANVAVQTSSLGRLVIASAHPQLEQGAVGDALVPAAADPREVQVSVHELPEGLVEEGVGHPVGAGGGGNHQGLGHGAAAGWGGKDEVRMED